MTPRISVLVASYNQKRHLAEAIEGVLAQTLPPSQVIVVDDCSSDGSRDVIASYAARHPELIVPIYHGRNTGVAQARTDALGAVVGDYVTCIDGDDRWHSDKLRLEIATLRSHPDARWVYSGCSFIDQDGNVTGRFALPQEGREGCILVPTLCHEMALRDSASSTTI